MARILDSEPRDDAVRGWGNLNAEIPLEALRCTQPVDRVAAIDAEEQALALVSLVDDSVGRG